jgi:cobalamin biosynthesis Mg chelatase CobN
MPAGRPKAIDDSKVFDVAKPGNSRPIGTSRPVIVDSSAAVKDQMVDVPTAPSVIRKVITPITVAVEQQPAEPLATVVHELRLEPPKNDNSEEEVAPEEVAKPIAEAEANAPATSEAATVEAVADSTGNNLENKKVAEEQARQDAALQEMIDSKKYVVPLAHDSSGKGSSSVIIVAALILLLILAGVYLAIDAKVLKLSINLPHHFFKQ